MFKATLRLTVFALLLSFMTACNDDGGTVTPNNVNNPNMLDVNDNLDRGNGMNNNMRNGNLFDPNNDGLDMDMDRDLRINNNNGMFEREGRYYNGTPTNNNMNRTNR